MIPVNLFLHMAKVTTRLAVISYGTPVLGFRPGLAVFSRKVILLYGQWRCHFPAPLAFLRVTANDGVRWPGSSGDGC